MRPPRRGPHVDSILSVSAGVPRPCPWRIEPLGAADRKGLLEILEDRYNVTATLVTSQLDPADWHAVIGDATVGDAICDRLVHGAHRLTLHGESLRKVKPALTPEPKSKK